MKKRLSKVAMKIWRSYANHTKRHEAVTQNIKAMIIGQLQATREARGLSQQQLADLTGMKQSRISAIENATYDNVSIGTLKRIAKALDIALSVEFVSFKEFASRAADPTKSKTAVPGFSEEKQNSTVPRRNYQGRRPNVVD